VRRPLDRFLRLASLLFAALFALGAAVQYNDPDPLRWMLLYGAAAVTSLLAALGRLHWAAPGAVALVALLWAAALTSRVLGVVAPAELVSAWEMEDTRIEEGREMYGLLIIGGWMGVLALATRRRRFSR
jgi:hypothetical protein